MGDKQTGIYPKYRVSRTDGADQAGSKHDGCDLFVLDLTHDPHALPSIAAYAKSARADGYEILANELEAREGVKESLATDPWHRRDSKDGELLPWREEQLPESTNKRELEYWTDGNLHRLGVFTEGWFRSRSGELVPDDILYWREVVPPFVDARGGYDGRA